MTKRISPFTDFGFKYIFGQEKNKDLLIDFLNTLFAEEPGHETIVDVTFQDKELPRGPESERGVIYDIKCLTSSGKHFIVEMQNAQQSYFIDRSIYYASRSIVSQAQSGKDWRYEFKSVYVVSFLNFKMDALGPEVRTDVALCDLDTHKTVSDKIRFIYIQLPNFIKNEEQCEGIFDYWIYNIKNMENMSNIAFAQQHKIFKRLESVTNYANLDDAQRHAYDEDLKIYRDFQNCMDFKLQEGLKQGLAKGLQEGISKGRQEGLTKGRQEGISEGRQEEQINVIKKLAKNGMSPDSISQILELPVDSVTKVLSVVD